MSQYLVSAPEILAARKLSGDIDPADVSDTELTAIIIEASTHIDEVVGKSYISTDPAFTLVQRACKFFTSSFVREEFADPNNQGDDHYRNGMDILNIIMAGKNAPDDSFFAEMIAYDSWPLNEDAPIPIGGRGYKGYNVKKRIFVSDDDFIY